MSMLLGAHVVAERRGGKESGGKRVLAALQELHKMGGNVLQIFLSNPCSVRKADAVNWSDTDIKKVREFCEKRGIVLVIHSKYLLNLSREIDGRNMWALKSLIDDMIVAEKLGAVGCVVHMGSRGDKSLSVAEKLMRESVRFVLENDEVRGGKAKVILETSCGEGTKIGGDLDEMASLWRGFSGRGMIGIRERVGICVDTAHIFAGGSDIHKVGGLKKYFNKFNKLIGLENLTVIHLNDSGREYRSHVDKHAGLGLGHIFGGSAVIASGKGGKDGRGGKGKYGGEGQLEELLIVAKKWNIPVVLETHDNYNRELKLLRKLEKSLGMSGGGWSGGWSGKGAGREGSLGGNETLIRHFEKLRDFHKSFGADHIHEYNAYRKIVKVLKEYEKPIKSSANVRGVPGIGKRTLEKIDEILETGGLKMLKNVEGNRRLVAMIKLQTVMGIGHSKAIELVRRGIFSVEDLRSAVKKGDIKLNDKQMVALKYSKDLDKRIPRDEIKKYGEAVEKVLGKTEWKVVLAGSYMYGREDSGDIDIILVRKDLKTKKDVEKKGRKILEDVISKLTGDSLIIETLDLGWSKFMGLGGVGLGGKGSGRGSGKGTVRHIDIRLSSVDGLEMFKLYFGSGAEFSRWIRGVAKDKGYKLNEWGLEDRRSGRRVDNGTERDVFKKLGLDYIAPRDRV